MSTINRLSAAILATFFLQSAVYAAVETGTLNVTATVIAQCTVTTSPVAFGEISPTQAATATGSITISCDADNTLDGVVLDGGANELTGARRMKDSGTNYIPYTLTVPVGGLVDVNEDIVGDFLLTGTGPYVDTVTVTGNIAATGTARALGSYSDAVTVTLNYSAP